MLTKLGFLLMVDVTMIMAYIRILWEMDMVPYNGKNMVTPYFYNGAMGNNGNHLWYHNDR